MALGWTVIYRTCDEKIHSTTMVGSHDGNSAWDEAAALMNSSHTENVDIVAIVKGMNPAFIKNRDS